MSDIVERLSFDAVRCELQFSKGVAQNIEEAVDEISRLRRLLKMSYPGRHTYIKRLRSITVELTTQRDEANGRANAHWTGICHLRSINADLLAALSRLVNQLDLCHADKRYEAVWQSYHIHGGRYGGPTYIEELQAARAALTTARGDNHDRLPVSTKGTKMKSIEVANFRVLLDQLFHSMPITPETPEPVREIIKKLSALTYLDGKQGVIDARQMLARLEADCN